jgi:hypothetical protein
MDVLISYAASTNSLAASTASASNSDLFVAEKKAERRLRIRSTPMTTRKPSIKALSLIVKGMLVLLNICSTVSPQIQEKSFTCYSFFTSSFFL